jgi:hypothetical protein
MTAAALLRRIELAAHNEQLCLDLAAGLVGEARSTMLARVRLHAAERHQACAELDRLFEQRRAAVQALIARTEGATA